MKSRLIKGAFIGLGAIILSSAGILASDALRGVDGEFLNIASVGSSERCPKGTVLVKGTSGLLCVDQYEASPGETCPSPNPMSVIDTERNANDPSCYPQTIAGAQPWAYVTLTQAQRLCATAGKRLPTSDEWYALALGTTPDACVIGESAPKPTGALDCKSADGVYDMVGNVWEWVNETVTDTDFKGRTLPPEGYVAEADASGVAIATDTDVPNVLYGDDYFWSKTGGVFGMIRGGFYGSGSDAGLYTINASVPTNFATQGVGFRCVEDVI